MDTDKQENLKENVKRTEEYDTNKQEDLKETIKKTEKPSFFSKNNIILFMYSANAFLIAFAIAFLSVKIYKNFIAEKKSNEIFFGKIKKIAELGTIKLKLSDILTAKELESRLGIKFKGINGLILFKGEATLGIDMNDVKYKILDKDKKIMRVKLPEPKITFFKINNQKTKEIEVSSNSFTDSEKLSEFRRKMYVEAEKKMKEMIKKDKSSFKTAKNRVKLLISQFARKYGWKIEFSDLNTYEVKQEVKNEK